MIQNVGKTDVVPYDSNQEDYSAENFAKLGGLLRAGRAIVRGGAYVVGDVIGFVEDVVSGANDGDKLTDQLNSLISLGEANDLSIFDQ